MKSKKLTIVMIVLLIANIAATCVIGVTALGKGSTSKDDETAVQYVMYIGTNDKDTYTQLISTEEAKSIIDEICYKYLGGYTLQDATGSWADEKNMATHENTIVCYFDDADEAAVYKIADEVIEALNQNAVLIEKKDIRMEYYWGAD